MSQNQQQSFTWLLTEHTPTCYYNSPHFYWKIDRCEQIDIGLTLEVTGRVARSADDGFLSKKRLMVESILVLDENTVSSDDWLSAFQQKLAVFRDRVRNRTVLLLGADAGGLAVSLVFGSQAHLSEELRQSFEETGTLHILAVSGLHVSLLMGVLREGSRVLGVGRHTAVFLLVGVTGYVLLVGLKPSVLRAWAMICVALVARYVLHRQYHSVVTLLFVAIGLLFFRPDWLLHPGWQLSVAATASILLLGRRFEHVLGAVTLFPEVNGFSDRTNNWQWMSVWKQSLSISLAAQVATLPLVLYHFGAAPVLSFIPGSILTILAGIVLSGLFFGLTTVLVVSLVAPTFSVVLSGLLTMTLTVFVSMVSFFAQIDWWLVEYSR
ncbi:MAG: ComEC/Rec2 family competence protein [Patescibacteria group bacterium]